MRQSESMPTRGPHTIPLETRREGLVSRLADNQIYDLAIIGGGATGLGLALDAASRGYSVVVIEASERSGALTEASAAHGPRVPSKVKLPRLLVS